MSKILYGVEKRPVSVDGTILDRVTTKKQILFSEVQFQTDNLVGSFVSEATDLKTLSALLGAGAAYRFTRMGMLGTASSSLVQGRELLPLFLRGGSYAAGLAAESATFAGMERTFHRWEGKTPSGKFHQDWTKAALSLGSLKLFGRVTRGQNLVLQHLAVDSGMVVGHHLGYTAGLIEKPRGSLAQQMVAAEAMNWQMRAGMSLVHGLSPSFHAVEKSMDLILQSRKMGLPSLGNSSLPLPAFVEGPRSQRLEVREVEAEKSILRMSSNEGDGPKASGSGRTEESPPADRTPLPSTSENPGSVSADRSLLESLRKYLLMPTVIWRGIRAPRDQTKAWDRYWSSIQSTGRQGEVHWDSGSEVEIAKSLERLRTHVDFNLPIVDLGCGNGRHSRMLAEHFPKVLGVDVSSQAIEKAHQETPEPKNISYRVLDLTVPGSGRALAQEIGETNVYIRGVLHILDAPTRSAMVESIRELLGEKGSLYLQETNYQGSLLKYFKFMGASFTYMPTSLRRAIESGIRPPDHFGDPQLREYFPLERWEHLASGKTDLHAIPLRNPRDLHLVPGFFAVVRRRQGT